MDTDTSTVEAGGMNTVPGSLNNLFVREGLLKVEIDEKTGAPIIDWKQTKAIYLKMIGVFIHPEGLDGKWLRGKGAKYEQLRNRVVKLLFGLKDEGGIAPVSSITKWEDVQKVLDLPKNRVGDLVISNKAGYGWNEEMTKDLKLFSVPLKTGYKQAIRVGETKAMWTPFLVMGPGVKKGHRLSREINHVEQLPTILKLLNVEIPANVEGKPLYEIIE